VQSRNRFPDMSLIALEYAPTLTSRPIFLSVDQSPTHRIAMASGQNEPPVDHKFTYEGLSYDKPIPYQREITSKPR
jgi:hypothetical protein